MVELIFILFGVLFCAVVIVLRRRNNALLLKVRILTEEMETLSNEVRRQAQIDALNRRIDSYFANWSAKSSKTRHGENV